MKFLRKIFDNAHHKLEKNEKMKKFWPAIDAFDTLMFTPNTTTSSGAHIRDSIDLKRTMMLVIMALTPCLLFGIYNTGYQHFRVLGDYDASFFECIWWGAWYIVPIIAVSYAVGLGIEFIFAIKNQHSVAEGFLVSGMLIPLIMPIDVPLWQVAVATAFAVVIGKEVFGGTGMNILNVALTARAFLFFSHPTTMSGDQVWVSGYAQMEGDVASGATALGDLASTFNPETNVAPIVEKFESGLFNFWDSFIGLIPGSIGETSVIACLLGAVLLLATGIASWKVMASFFSGGLVMALIFNGIGGNAYFDLPAIHQLCLGGFMFGMVFMATDPVTACQTSQGKFIYGFLGGFLAILIRIANPAYPEGVMLAILIANVSAPLIDHMVVRANMNKRVNRLKAASHGH